MAPTPTKKIVASTPNNEKIASVALVTPSKEIALVASVASVASISKKDDSPQIPIKMKQQGLFGYMKKRAPPVLSIKDLHPGEAKFSRLRGWNNSGTVLSLPIKQQKELLKLKVLLKTAINKKDWLGGDSLQQDVNRLKKLIAARNNNIEEAKGALKESLQATAYYIAEGKLLMAGKWDTTALAGQAVLAHYFQDEAEREKTARRKSVVLDADDPREEEADEPGAL